MSQEKFSKTPERLLEEEFEKFGFFNPEDNMEEFRDK